MLFATLLLLLSSSADPNSLPPGEGKAIVERACISCHAVKVVTSKRATKEQWSALVDQMMSRGAELNDDEVDVVVDYLSKNFGVDKPPAEPEKKQSQTAWRRLTQTQTARTPGLSPKESVSVFTCRRQSGAVKELQTPTTVPGIETGKIDGDKNRLAF